MSDELAEAVQALCGSAIVSRQPVGGGCIHRSEIVELADGRRRFLKSNPHAERDLFEAEAAGLQALAGAGAIRVPGEPVVGDAGGVPFLVMEAIETGRRPPDFFDTFGRELAELHRSTRRERHGFDRPGYIGSTAQPNDWSDDWLVFWRDRRLGFQLDLAAERGRSNGRLDRLGRRLLDRLDRWIPAAEPACLLHGDLWSGNYLVGPAGEPVIVDPAAYWGAREADLAMTRLFGGFETSFYGAYEQAWPLEPGSGERLPLYELYHLLNHLNLFGAAYHGRCLEILERYVG